LPNVMQPNFASAVLNGKGEQIMLTKYSKNRITEPKNL
jgi:hypothetical protein